MTARELMEVAESEGLLFTLENGMFKLVGNNSQGFVERYREEIKRNKQAILALLRGETPPIPDEDVAHQARMEFALAFRAKVEQDVDAGVPEWLEWAFWCLFSDAMEGFTRWGLGDIWPQVQEVAQERQQTSGMRHRALEGWASWHRERERHRYSARWGAIDAAWIERRDQLALECETWAWRAYLLELARINPEGDDQQRLDLWVDLRPWALWLARNGKRLGLVWSDKEAA